MQLRRTNHPADRVQSAAGLAGPMVPAAALARAAGFASDHAVVGSALLRVETSDTACSRIRVSECGVRLRYIGV